MKNKNKYVDFISDEHFLNCIENLHKSYLKAKEFITKKKFYSNKVDVIKLIFDSNFNEIDEEKLIKLEIIRQIDKSINNAIGTFHEQILGGIKGFQTGISGAGFDIKADDNSLFADIKNKHNTVNSSSSESLFQRLADFANEHEKSKCYLVQILAKKSFRSNWNDTINGKKYSHSRLYKISGDKFYELLSGKEDAFFQLYKNIPIVIKDYKNSLEKVKNSEGSSVLDEIERGSIASNRTIFDQITFENYAYYSGFDKL